jgi:hypothetical protein
MGGGWYRPRKRPESDEGVSMPPEWYKEKVMKRTMIAVAVALVSLFGTQTVLAQAPAKTRAQVTAECDAAKKAGKVVEGECQYEMPAPGTSTKTRAQVTAECDAAKKAGKVVEGQCQYEMPTKMTSTKTREQVKAECEAYKKAKPGQPLPAECQM